MPVIKLKNKTGSVGNGWTESRLLTAQKLVHSESLDIDPLSMTHEEFCQWWGEYRISQF